MFFEKCQNVKLIFSTVFVQIRIDWQGERRILPPSNHSRGNAKERFTSIFQFF